MSEQEKKVRSNFRFNALDIAVVLIIIALVVTAVFRAGLIDKLTFSSKPCTVILSVEKVDSRISAAFTGQNLYTENGDVFGKVTAVSESPSSVTVTDNDGIERSAEYPVDYVRNLDISAECNLSVKDGRYVSFEGDIIVPGAVFTLHTANFTFICTVSSVTD